MSNDTLIAVDLAKSVFEIVVRTDAKGMLEAYRNEDIRPVPVKTVEQQTIAFLHRLRSAWLAERTAAINTLRGLRTG